MDKDLFGHNYNPEHLKQMIEYSEQEAFFHDVDPAWAYYGNDDQLEFDFEKEIGIDMQQKVDKLSKRVYYIDNA